MSLKDNIYIYMHDLAERSTEPKGHENEIYDSGDFTGFEVALFIPPLAGSDIIRTQRNSMRRSNNQKVSKVVLSANARCATTYNSCCIPSTMTVHTVFIGLGV